MTDDKIAEIRKRHEADTEIATVLHPELPPTWTLAGWIAHNDRATLLAEVARLRAGMFNLAEWCEFWKSRYRTRNCRSDCALRWRPSHDPTQEDRW